MATGYSQGTHGRRQAPRNKFGAQCRFCGDWVAPECGYLCGKDEAAGRWRVRCAECEPEPEPQYRWQPPPRNDPPPRSEPPRAEFEDDPITRQLREALNARIAFLRA